MRIVHLFQYFAPKLGYQEFFLAKTQQELGHEIYAISSDRYFPPPHFSGSVAKMLGKRIIGCGVFKEEGITVYRLPCFFEYQSSSIVILNNLKEILVKIKPDVIHTHEVFSIPTLQVALLKDRLGFKLVCDSHATDYNTSFSDSLLKKIYGFLFKRIIGPIIKGKADVIVAVGRAERLFVCRILGMNEKEMPIIELGADTDLFKFNKKIRDEKRKVFKIKDKEILIIYAGKITYNKDVHVLIKAALPLIKEDSQLKLLILGGGDENYIKELREMVENGKVEKRVIFYPFVQNRELYQYYCAADLGIWPGDSSVATQEGMAVNLPVVLPIGSPDLATSEDCLENDNGLPFKRGDVRGLRLCMEKIIKNPIEMKKMGLRSRELIEKKYSWEIISQRFIKIYLECLKNKI